MSLNKNPVVLWNRDSLSKALNQHISFDFEAIDVVIDSRDVKPGYLFIGLTGRNFNGSKFADEAILKGAVACIVNEIYSENEFVKQKIILVSDAHDALNMMAIYFREKTQAKIIGVTGSVGKTTTKEMLRTVLEGQADVFATIGNLNNMYGLPLCLSKTPLSKTYCVYEMGISQKDEMRNYTEIAKPDIAVITTIEPVHFESFNSVEEIARAKAEIFLGMRPNHGTVILNIDNQYYPILLELAVKAKLKVISFGKHVEANVRLLDVVEDDGGKEESIVKIIFQGKEIIYKLNFIAEHLAFNTLAVLAVCVELGIDINKAASDLSKFSLLKGRGKAYHLNQGIILLDDTYNSSPCSTRAALTRLAKYKITKEKQRSIAILGDMNELGKHSIEFHESLIEDLLINKIDRIFTIGKMMNYLFQIIPNDKKVLHTQTSEEMCDQILQYLEPNDVVLVKGSNSINMNKLTTKILENFN